MSQLPDSDIYRCALRACLTVLAAACFAVTAAAGDEPPGGPVLDTSPNGALQIEPIAGEEPVGVDAVETDRQTPEFETKQIPIRRFSANADRNERPWYRSGLMSLVVVLALVMVAAFFARRFIGSAQAPGARALSVLSRVAVSPKQSIALVQMGRRFAFVGITADRMTTLHLVEDAEESAALRSELRRDVGRKRVLPFDDVLAGEQGEMTAHVESALSPTAHSARQVARTREDLKGLLSTLRSFSRTSGSRGAGSDSPAGRTGRSPKDHPDTFSGVA